MLHYERHTTAPQLAANITGFWACTSNTLIHALPSSGALKPSAPSAQAQRAYRTASTPTRQGLLEAQCAQARPDLAANAHQVKGQGIEACGGAWRVPVSAQ